MIFPLLHPTTFCDFNSIVPPLCSRSFEVSLAHFDRKIASSRPADKNLIFSLFHEPRARNLARHRATHEPLSSLAPRLNRFRGNGMKLLANQVIGNPTLGLGRSTLGTGNCDYFLI